MLSQPLRQATTSIESIIVDESQASMAEERSVGDDARQIQPTKSSDDTHGLKSDNNDDNKSSQVQCMGFVADAINGADENSDTEDNAAEYNYAGGNNIPSHIYDHTISNNVAYASLSKICCTRNDGIINKDSQQQGQSKMQGEMNVREDYKMSKLANKLGTLDCPLGELTVDLGGGMICVCNNNNIIDKNKAIDAPSDSSNMKVNGNRKILNTINVNIIATDDRVNNVSVTPVNFNCLHQGDRRDNGHCNIMGRDTYDNQVRDETNKHCAQSRCSKTFSAKTAILDLGLEGQQIHTAPYSTTTVHLRSHKLKSHKFLKMTAPSSASDNSNGGGSNAASNNRENESNGNGASQPDQPDRSVHGQREPRTDSAQNENEHPELDDFVNGFYDGDKFTDVDSRVWV
ncbi:hypothetical protein BGX27_001766 [Mortierella sp. AM989]|nr:hypothetical protein BGX27_001766 [Mortierella sp. AM989]